jgi:tRNA (adenine57-N1/adenine58-N1)-methyltransferase
MEADIFPGATVLEAGMGSGALTMALLRAVGREGQVISYEIREDMLKRAIKNITPVLPNRPNHTIRLDDIYNGIAENEIDRIILDLPEPWRAVPHVAQALVPGGILLCFLPTVLQVHRLVETLDSSPFFDIINTLETFQRPWHVTKQSMRPEHRMVAHTGFLTTARLCSPNKKIVSPDIEQEPEETGADLDT